MSILTHEFQAKVHHFSNGLMSRWGAVGSDQTKAHKSHILPTDAKALYKRGLATVLVFSFAEAAIGAHKIGVHDNLERQAYEVEQKKILFVPDHH